MKKKIWFDHDGGVDDLLSLMLLLTMDDIDLIGISITPADCYLADATDSTLTLLTKFNRTDIPVFQGSIHGINDFPPAWRAGPKILTALPAMLNTKVFRDNLSHEAAHVALANYLANSENPVTLLMTGPCTHAAAALVENPAVKHKIDEIIWMGGAVNVPGNVVTYNHDSSAEWNVFWDPVSANALFSSGLNIKLIALDATNALPIDLAFLKQLAALTDCEVAQLAGQFWATTINTIPAYEYTYYMWDVLSTCCVGECSQHVDFVPMELDVSVQEPNAGQTFASSGNGQWINVATAVDRDAVIQYVLNRFSRNFS